MKRETTCGFWKCCKFEYIPLVEYRTFLGESYAVHSTGFRRCTECGRVEQYRDKSGAGWCWIGAEEERIFNQCIKPGTKDIDKKLVV